MTEYDIEYLEAILEDHPENHETRLILADLYDDIGHPLADTLRWMAQNGRCPSLFVGEADWYLGFEETEHKHLFPHMLPYKIFSKLRQQGCYTSVKAATEDLHEALFGGEASE